MKKYLLIISSLTVLFLVVLATSVIIRIPEEAKGSVMIGGEYHSTSTGPGTPNFWLLQTGSGTLGSVTITSAGTFSGNVEFIDATTTDFTKRTKSGTTTIASFPATAAAGTYVFDAVFYDGLIISVPGRASTTPVGMASSTIMYR